VTANIFIETTLKANDEDRLVHAMQLLGDKTRFKMFQLLRSDVSYCVGEIASQLHISASAVSQHFRTFEHLGFVNKKRDGLRICYSLKQDDHLTRQLVYFIDTVIINSKGVMR
jgi:DNA-binding transcriptional ArsR family regulator